MARLLKALEDARFEILLNLYNKYGDRETGQKFGLDRLPAIYEQFQMKSESVFISYHY